jgi:phosphoglycerate dehydrogenase-like enzyme
MTNLLIVLTLPEPVRNVYRDRLAAAFPELRIDMVDHHSKAGPYVNDADIILSFGVQLSDACLQGPRLAWVQALGSGVDGIVDQPSLRDDVVVTNMQGLHGAPCAEAAMCGMLSLARAMPRVLDNQKQARWERFPVRLIDGKTAVLVGVGVIAEALAPRCKAMGMHVVGVSGARRELPGFDEMMPRDQLIEAAARADYLVVLAPYSPQNHHLVDAEVLAAMKPSSYVVNIARGGVVDEDALLQALREKRISGACLDVFNQEPLPAQHPFWGMENVIVMPHLAGFHDEYPDRALPIVEHNIRKFFAGDVAGMINVVKDGRTKTL